MNWIKRQWNAFLVLIGLAEELTMEDVIRKLNERFAGGWTLVGFSIHPMAGSGGGPSSRKTVIVTLRSPDTGGESPQFEQTVKFANVLPSEISWDK